MKTSKHTFFCTQIDDLKLSKEEAHHAFKVLRLTQGNKINIIDGKGRFVVAEIVTVNKNELLFSIIKSTIADQPKVNIHVAIAPTKSNERIEFFLEKATEIGISEITPLLAKNSERKMIKPERWQKIITAAAKQSNNLHFPILNELTKFDDFLKQHDSNEVQYFIAHCENDENKKELKNEVKDLKNICILIGPEGDFTVDEIKNSLQNNYIPVSIGQTRLRTETAGIVACHTVNLMS